MGESLAGEIIGLFAGGAICIPLIFQINSQLCTPTKSPLSRYCWWLWAFGWLGVGAFFSFVPRAPDQRQVMDSPESPRTIGYVAFIACLLCQVIWALDGVSPASAASQKTKKVIEIATPGVVVTVLLAVGIRLVHGSFILSRPFYRDFLAFVAFILTPCFFGASIIAPLELNESQLRNSGPEVAGLFWMPVAMQMLGLFAAIFTSTLLYTNPDWYGVIILSLFFAADALYIGIGVMKLMDRRSSQYGPIA